MLAAVIATRPSGPPPPPPPGKPGGIVAIESIRAKTHFDRWPYVWPETDTDDDEDLMLL